MDSVNAFVGRHQGEKVKRMVLVLAQKVGNWIMSRFDLLHSSRVRDSPAPRVTPALPGLCSLVPSGLLLQEATGISINP